MPIDETTRLRDGMQQLETGLRSDMQQLVFGIGAKFEKLEGGLAKQLAESTRLIVFSMVLLMLGVITAMATFADFG